MGAPVPKVEAVDNSTAEALLNKLEFAAPAERRKHASVFNYWLSIKGDRQFPPIRDLDPLEISDAGPWSVLLEMIGAGENAVIRHFGQAIKLGVDAETIARAPNPSLLHCIHDKLPLVASSMQAIAFEDSFQTADGTTRCWVTLLPFSASGTWIDYVYGFVSLEAGETAASYAEPIDAAKQETADQVEADHVPLRAVDEEPQPAETDFSPVGTMHEPDSQSGPEPEEPVAHVDDDEPLAEHAPAFEVANGEADIVPLAPIDSDLEPDSLLETVNDPETRVEASPEATGENSEPLVDDDVLVLEDEAPPARAGFSSKFLESLAHVGGFYGRVVQTPDPTVGEIDPAAVAEPHYEMEGTLESKLSDVRAMAEEARMAQIRSDQALYAGLGAAYDFALDAEEQPEEYLRLVEGQGLKIQLRSPMKPVVKLAFAESCDDATISQLEAVLAWALKQDLPRGTLAERIEAEGGIGSILNGLGKAA